MCGINVIFDQDQDPQWISDMNQALVHRGPDAEGTFNSPSQPISLGSRRLKIIDLHQGDMPYHSPCGRYTMVYNGEVYNFEDLKSKLKDYAFSSDTDGEVLFAYFQTYGIKALSDCNGMFSFALWDEQTARLTIGRDRLGIKPLFYAFHDSKLYLSSEIKALKTIPGLDEGLDEQALYHYLSLLSIPEPHSIHPKIKRFPKAQYAVFQDKKLCFHPYWDISFKKQTLSSSAWTKKIRQTFFDAVERRLVSDVPMGLLLSAGIDSTILAHTLKTVFDKNIHCYSLGFEGGEDESQLAQKTANNLDLPFKSYQLKPESLVQHIPTIIQNFSEPFGGGLPLWFLCKQFNKDITVGLTGTGGDELFGNYGRTQHLAPHLGPWRGLKTLLKNPTYLNHQGETLESLQYTLEHGAPMGHFYHDKNYPTKEALKKTILLSKNNQRTDLLFEETLWSQQHLAKEDRVFLLDLKTQLSDEFLYSQDILSMSHHIELRVPFLDHTLVELMASVPVHLRSNSKNPKGWLKTIFSDLIPTHILNQPKRGFMIPYGQWMRHELKTPTEHLLSDSFLKNQNLFHSTTITQIWQQHLNGQDQTYTLWPLLMFQLWYAQQHHIEIKW